MLAAIFFHGCLRMKRAVIVFADHLGRAHFRAKHALQARVCLHHSVLVVFAARHAALIGDHEQNEIVFQQQLQRQRDAGKNLQLIWIAQVARVVDQRSIAVKKNRRPQSGLAG